MKWLIALAVVLMVLIGCVSYDSCSKRTGNDKVVCYAKLAAKTGSLEPCDVFEDNDKTQCYFNYAIKTKDCSACSLLEDEQPLVCYGALAGSIPDTSVCTESDNELYCFAIAATVNLDYDLCNGLDADVQMCRTMAQYIVKTALGDRWLCAGPDFESDPCKILAEVFKINETG